MTQHLSEEELAEFREIFNLVDRDGGGTITKEELGELMDTLGIDATAEEIDLMINEIDQDSNGEIDFEGSSPRARAACLVVTGTRTLSAALTFPIRPPHNRVCGCDVTKGQCHVHRGAGQERFQGAPVLVLARDPLNSPCSGLPDL